MNAYLMGYMGKEALDAYDTKGMGGLRELAGLGKAASAMYHYVKPEFAADVDTAGIKALPSLLRSRNPKVRRFAESRLESYHRFLEEGEEPTHGNLLKAIGRFRGSDRGASSIFGLQELYDPTKGNAAGNEWLADRIAYKINLRRLKRDGLLEDSLNLDAPPIDYSKLDDKVVFKDIPHPSIRVKGDVIHPKYLDKQAYLNGYTNKEALELDIEVGIV